MRVIARLVGPYLVGIREVSEDDDHVLGRSPDLGEAAIDPGLGVLEIDVFEDHDGSAFGDRAALKVSEALHQSVHGLLPLVPTCSSSLARRSASSNVPPPLTGLGTGGRGGEVRG